MWILICLPMIYACDSMCYMCNAHTCRAVVMVSTRVILAAAVLALAVFVAVIQAQEK